MKRAIVLFLAASLLSKSVKAATVTTTADSGPGSLRDAIATAAPGETINFAVTGTITLTSGELLITNTLNIVGPGAANLTVQRSPSAGTPAFRIFNVRSGIVAISGLTVSNGDADSGGGINNQTTFTLRDCVITGNSATNSGGGINNLSSLTMSNCVISGNSVSGSMTAGGGGIDNQGTLAMMNCLVCSNSATGRTTFPSLGGGIYNTGTLTLTNSTISGNSAIGISDSEGEGGGICNRGTLTLDTSTVSSNLANGRLDSINSIGLGGGIDNGNGTVTLNRSTVANNLATGAFGWGAGVNNSAGTVIVENSTVSGNIANSSRPGVAAGGGGIANLLGSVTINHSTITANILVPSGTSADGGGGVLNTEGVVQIKNSILAGNASVVDVFNRPLSDINSDGYNLFGTTNGPINPGTNDRFNLTAAALRLGPLQNNGGPTFTHALLCGSPAINAGDNTGAPPTDQRGFPRIVGGVIDIGAYEYNNTPPAISCSAPLTNCIPGAQVVATTISANVADADGDPLVVVWTVDGTALQTNNVPAGGPPTTASVDFTVLLGIGAHEVTATVSDPSECVAVCTTEVVFNANPTVTAGNNGPVCAGSTLKLTVVSSTKHSFSWSGPNNFSSTLPNPSITNATPAASGVYTVTVTDANGCTASAMTTATVNPHPTVTATNNGPVCAGSTLGLSASSTAAARVSYAWRGPNGFVSTQQNPLILNATPAASGTYTVTVTDANGCTASAMTTATVNAKPTVTAGNNGPVCAGSTLSLTASSPTAVSYRWSGPNGFSSSVQNPTLTNATPEASGNYTVTVTDANGCTATAPTTVLVKPATQPGNLYPIALSQKTLSGVAIGTVLPDIYNGIQPGNFGWLTWAGSPSEPTLVTSLTPPGNSSTYANPENAQDHVVSVGDWLQGKPGISNSDKVRKALDKLEKIDITVPVWDKASSKGNNSLYHVVAFARVRIISYQLPKQNRITARFLGFVDCN